MLNNSIHISIIVENIERLYHKPLLKDILTIPIERYAKIFTLRPQNHHRNPPVWKHFCISPRYLRSYTRGTGVEIYFIEINTLRNVCYSNSSAGFITFSEKLYIFLWLHRLGNWINYEDYLVVLVNNRKGLWKHIFYLIELKVFFI